MESIIECSVVKYAESQDISYQDGIPVPKPGSYRASIDLRLPDGRIVTANLSAEDFNTVVSNFPTVTPDH